MYPLLSQTYPLSKPKFMFRLFFMAEINHRSCHNDVDDDNSDLLWLITEEQLFPMFYVYGADD
jgi:hypothetical protein